MTEDDRTITGLPAQLSRLCSLFTLAMVMSDGRGEWQIIELVTSSVASLALCRPVASYLTMDSRGLRAADGAPLTWPELSAQLDDLGDGDGPVTGTGSGWAHAYALPTVRAHAGHLVVAADTEPPPDQLLLLWILAQQTGRALTTASMHRRDREIASELRAVNAELAGVNRGLARTTRRSSVRALAGYGPSTPHRAGRVGKAHGCGPARRSRSMGRSGSRARTAPSQIGSTPHRSPPTCWSAWPAMNLTSVSRAGRARPRRKPRPPSGSNGQLSGPGRLLSGGGHRAWRTRPAPGPDARTACHGSSTDLDGRRSRPELSAVDTSSPIGRVQR